MGISAEPRRTFSAFLAPSQGGPYRPPSLDLGQQDLGDHTVELAAAGCFARGLGVERNNLIEGARCPVLGEASAQWLT